MKADREHLHEAVRRWTLFLGVLQIAIGCLVGLVPPSMVAWFRGIVMAHLAFTANGVLMIALGLLVREMHLGPKTLTAWFALLQVGTWMNGAAGLLSALLGASSKFTPTANGQFPPPGGTGNGLVSAALVLCALCILASLGITLYGLVRAWPSANRLTRR